MSKKAVRVQRSFAKQWFAVICGSVVSMTTQSAQAAPENRVSLREFRGNHDDLSRHEARQLFRQEHRALRNSIGGGGTPDASSITMVAPTTFVSWVDKNGVVRCGNPPKNMLNDNRIKDNIRNQSVQNLNGDVVRLNNGVDLNLSASDANITLGNNLFNKVDSLTITVGGVEKTVSAGSNVTSAEYVAVKQVLAGGSQKIVVDGAGKASGGEFDLNSISASHDVMRASSLVIPENVTSYGQFGRGSEFRLVGDLDNYGSLIASSNSRRGSIIKADDVTNHSGAVISSVKNDLNVLADGSLTNSGTITSAASLTLAAGGTLANSGNVEARRNVTLHSSSINNSGTVTATSGDVTLDGPATAALNVNNAGGQISALNGAINLRNSAYEGNFNSLVEGGDLLSKEFNINAGNATADVRVDQLTGEINQKGLGVHVLAATDTLTIGDTCLTGDPTYYNTLGSINIAGSITVGEELTLIARDNITSANGITISAGNAAQGFNVSLLAGVNILGTVGGADQPTVGPIPPANANNGAVSTQGGTANGGSIDFGTNVTINTRPTGATGPGGDVDMFAFAGNGFGSGVIEAGGVTINAGGKGVAFGNGSVTLVGGASNTTAINILAINTTGGSPSAGQVTLATAQPQISSGSTFVGYVATGALFVGAGFGEYVASSTLSANADLSIGSVNAGTLNARSGGNMTFSSAASNVSQALLTTDGSLFANGNITATNQFLAFGKGNFQQFGTSTITATNIFGLNFDGTIISSTTSLLSSASMIVISGKGNIGVSPGLRLRVDADNLLMSAFSGSAFVVDTDSVTLAASNVGNVLDVQSVDALTVGDVVTGDVVKLRSSADAIVLTADVSAGTSATLRANTDIVGGAGSTVSGNLVSLTADSADIGGLAQPVNVNADNLVVFAPGAGAVISEADSVNLGGGTSFVGSTLRLTAAGAITNTSLVTANSMILDAGTVLGLSAPISANTLFDVNSGGTLTNANISSNLTTNQLVLRSDTSVGTALNPFLVNGSSSVQSPLILAESLTGSVFIRGQGAGGTTFGLVQAQSTIDLQSTSGLTLTDDVRADTNVTGNIQITANSGTLQINDVVQILSMDDINISNKGTNKTNDKINIGNDVAIATSAKNPGDGNVTIVLGVNSGKAKKSVKNVVFDLQGGTIQVKGKGITAKASTPSTTFKAQGADIVIANSTNLKNFTLGESVIITADPPVPAGTPIVIITHEGNSGQVGMVSATQDLSFAAPVSSALTLENPATLNSLNAATLNSMNAASNAVTLNSLNASTLKLTDSSNFNLFATLPATDAIFSAGDADFDDSYSTTSPSAYGIDAKLLSDDSIGDVHTMNNDKGIFVASRDTTVVSPLGTVKLAAGSVTFIMSQNGQLSVYDLEDRHKGSVVIESAGRQISLSPGRHVTVTRFGAEQYCDVNPAEAIMHRSVSKQKLNTSSTLFQSEFSLPSAIASIKPLMRIVKSNHIAHKKITQRLLKTSAILMQLGSGAPYSVHTRTKMVALNN